MSVTDVSPLQIFVDRARKMRAEVVECGPDSLAGILREWTESPDDWSVRLTDELSSLRPSLVALERGDEHWPQIVVGSAGTGVADTGSIIPAPGSHRDRLLALLCFRHVVLLSPQAIMPSLRDVPPLLRSALAAGTGAYSTLVSGPSRTSDIERVLTIGVHGPRELVVVLVEGDESGAD